MDKIFLFYIWVQYLNKNETWRRKFFTRCYLNPIFEVIAGLTGTAEME